MAQLIGIYFTEFLKKLFYDTLLSCNKLAAIRRNLLPASSILKMEVMSSNETSITPFKTEGHNTNNTI